MAALGEVILYRAAARMSARTLTLGAAAGTLAPHCGQRTTGGTIWRSRRICRSIRSRSSRNFRILGSGMNGCQAARSAANISGNHTFWASPLGTVCLPPCTWFLFWGNWGQTGCFLIQERRPLRRLAVARKIFRRNQRRPKKNESMALENRIAITVQIGSAVIVQRVIAMPIRRARRDNVRVCGQLVAVRGQLKVVRGQLVAVRGQLKVIRGQLKPEAGRRGVPRPLNAIGLCYSQSPGRNRQSTLETPFSPDSSSGQERLWKALGINLDYPVELREGVVHPSLPVCHDTQSVDGAGMIADVDERDGVLGIGVEWIAFLRGFAGALTGWQCRGPDMQVLFGGGAATWGAEDSNQRTSGQNGQLAPGIDRRQRASLQRILRLLAIAGNLKHFPAAKWFEFFTEDCERRAFHMLLMIV